MPKSVDKLISAAKECFFQHGFCATNVSLIGRYAGISRATIYKNFSSKEDIFRALVQQHIDQNKDSLQQYSLSDGDFWQDTEMLITGRCKGLFDDISSNLIRSELIHAGQTQCHDIIHREKEEIQAVILKRLEREIAQDKLDMTRIELTTKQFAQVIESVPMGVAVSSMEENNFDLIRQMFKVFKASTTIKAKT